VNKNETKTRTATVDLFFPSTTAPMPSADPFLSVKLIRGRITAQQSWLRLELNGTPEAIDAYLRQNRTGDVAA